MEGDAGFADLARILRVIEKSGKTSMETRWKQKETSFGFSLKSAWNKQEGYFSKERDFCTATLI